MTWQAPLEVVFLTNFSDTRFRGASAPKPSPGYGVSSPKLTVTSGPRAWSRRAIRWRS